jgi:hypothetical protein
MREAEVRGMSKEMQHPCREVPLQQNATQFLSFINASVRPEMNQTS